MRVRSSEALQRCLVAVLSEHTQGSGPISTTVPFLPRRYALSNQLLPSAQLPLPFSHYAMQGRKISATSSSAISRQVHSQNGDQTQKLSESNLQLETLSAGDSTQRSRLPSVAAHPGSEHAAQLGSAPSNRCLHGLLSPRRTDRQLGWKGSHGSKFLHIYGQASPENGWLAWLL